MVIKREGQKFNIKCTENELNMIASMFLGHVGIGIAVQRNDILKKVIEKEMGADLVNDFISIPKRGDFIAAINGFKLIMNQNNKVRDKNGKI